MTDVCRRHRARPPESLALAKAVESVPAEDALPSGCLYEPKWDGYFRAHWWGPVECRCGRARARTLGGFLFA